MLNVNSALIYAARLTTKSGSQAVHKPRHDTPERYISFLVEKRGNAKMLAGQWPPHKPFAELPPCPLSELLVLTSFAEACPSHHAHFWMEAMAKAFRELEGSGTLGIT